MKVVNTSLAFFSLWKILFIVLLFGFWSCEEKDKYGCLNSQACNYDSDATIDNNSCEYLDCNNKCGGGGVVVAIT